MVVYPLHGFYFQVNPSQSLHGELISLLLLLTLLYFVVVIADAGHSLAGCTGARELRFSR